MGNFGQCCGRSHENHACGMHNQETMTLKSWHGEARWEGACNPTNRHIGWLPVPLRLAQKAIKEELRIISGSVACITWLHPPFDCTALEQHKPTKLSPDNCLAQFSLAASKVVICSV